MKLYLKDSEIISTPNGSKIKAKVIEPELEEQSGSPPEANENILKIEAIQIFRVILDLENDQVLINRKNDGNIDILPLDNNLKGISIRPNTSGKD
ncbi:ANL_collapsed_G0042150.mRNA.1.CDS.1 [Saccharomyces cerevisiae]|nr:ANL_collapsed_G0042150.mRNA.1.CDS.1 [Saccharomyces cerevisiae]